MTPYDLLEKQYASVNLASGNMFPAECTRIEEAIVFSFGLYFGLKKDLARKDEDLAALFYRNCVYLSASYKMIRMGMLDPAGNNMRTVFETIIWQYAYSSDQEAYANFCQIAQMEDEKLSGNWSGTKERKLQNLRRKYSFQKMMKHLYSKQAYERFFFNQYWVLSQKSHSSTFGVNYNTPNMEGTTTMEKNPAELQKNLRAILYLCAENLLCFLNCFKLNQKKVDLSLSLINTINREIPPALSLVPDTMELPFMVRFKEVI